MTEIIATFTDEEIKAHVARIDRGFSVAIQDIDSELFFETVLIFATEVEAIAAAKKAAHHA